MKKRHNKASESSFDLYSNLTHKRAAKKRVKAREKAAYLAKLPENPWKRFLYRINPKNWFTKRKFIAFLKGVGIVILVLAAIIGGMFIYFRKDIESISPGELSKKVQTTVNTYLDRNGNVLWEDKGSGNYKLVVDDSEISPYLKYATVAIEDRDFYKHGGISIPGIFRAFINNITGGDTQGGSTLTQQLVKQVFFADEASQRGISGIPRKIKEMFLSVEVERMYSKNQILDLYLNESPYGGRRNGVESASQIYFGKSAKDLSIAEAALLAAIPQNPSVYNPYNTEGNQALITRQHTVIDYMEDQGYISASEAKTAKAYPILDHITPESDQYSDIKAPHFVQMARAEAIKKLGATTVGKGGLTIKTSLDLRVQNKLEEAMNDMFSSYYPSYAGFSNGASTVEDNSTGQIIALMGSRDFNYTGYGQDNAATSYIQPGSTIKALVYTELFENKGSSSQNYGSGSILSDVNIDSLYGAKLRDSDNSFWGNITIRTALANSRNIPAVKAMYISGTKNTLNLIHNMGGTSYCTQGSETSVGLASAIGGCGIKQVDLVNAYASIARGGVYKDQTTLISIKNSTGQTLYKYSDSAGKRIASEQATYIVDDILSDDTARSRLVARNLSGFVISGVKTATKTGTSDTGGHAKDIWMMSYSPALTMGVWLGNNDTSVLKNGNSTIPRSIVNTVMSYAHKEIYASENKWKSGDWFTKPSGIQTIGTELYPSWWNKNQKDASSETMVFDKVSKKKATSYTPDGAKITLTVTKVTDPITKKVTFTASDSSYDPNSDDDVHKAGDAKPSISVKAVDGVITATVSPGTFSTINSVQISIGGATASMSSSGSNTYTYTNSSSSAQNFTITVTDSGYYTGSASGTLPAAESSSKT